MKKLILMLTIVCFTISATAQFDFDYIIGMDYENVKSEYESYNELADTISCTLNNNEDGTEIILAKTEDDDKVLFEIHLAYHSVWNEVNKVVVSSNNNDSKQTS